MAYEVLGMSSNATWEIQTYVKQGLYHMKFIFVQYNIQLMSVWAIALNS